MRKADFITIENCNKEVDRLREVETSLRELLEGKQAEIAKLKLELHRCKQKWSEMYDEIDQLREALVYVAHAGHGTPQNQLPAGVMLGDNNYVEVRLNAGLIVRATHGA